MDSERLLNEFLTLLDIPSPSMEEGRIRDYVFQGLKDAGLDVIRVDSGGNLIAGLDGKGNNPILLCAHLDTVAIKGNVRPVRRGDYIYGDGTCILGADDKAGIAIILEVVRTIQEESKAKHPPLELVFTVEEELGMLGAKRIDYGRISSRIGFVVDGDEGVGCIINHVPSRVDFRIEIMGKAAHAGSEPQKGISAIVVAAEAISRLKIGRVDDETTSNIGLISGGEGVNIVPETTHLEGEVRSRDPKKLSLHLNEIKETFMDVANKRGAKVKIDVRESFQGFKVGSEERVTRLAIMGARDCGLRPRLLSSGIGSDMNVLNQHGIRSVILGIGIKDAHTSREHISVKDLYDATRWILSIIRKAYEEEL